MEQEVRMFIEWTQRYHFMRQPLKLMAHQGFKLRWCRRWAGSSISSFRISNAGDETEATMKELYAALDKAMKSL